MELDLKLILDILTLTGLGIAGVFVLLGRFDKERKANEEVVDRTEEKVIKLLKEQVEALERKVGEQASALETMNVRLNDLVRENKTMRDLLQGRDKSTLDYQAQGRAAMVRGDEIYDMVKEIRLTVDKLASGQVNVNVQK